MICSIFTYVSLVMIILAVDGTPLFRKYRETVFSAEEIARANASTIDINIRMTEKEIALFQRYLAKSTSYFEFGCGGSTILACKTGPPALSVTSVDSSQEWINLVLNNPHVASKTASKLLQMRTIDIGPVGAWGYPTVKAEESKGAWYMYSQAISLTEKSYDLVLVDGRFRVACVLNSFISNPKASVLIHDFFTTTHHSDYKPLLSVCDVVDRGDTLVALRTKKNVSKEDLMKLYATFINVPTRRLSSV